MKKGPIFGILLLSMVFLFLEIVSHLTQAFLKGLIVGVDFKTTRELYADQREFIRRMLQHETNILFDPDLGWRYRTVLRSPHCNKTPDLHCDTDHSYSPPGKLLRISAFGDSFVYGSEVEDRSSWPTQLESILPSTQVLNFGVGGYGTDQAYLMYEKFGRLHQSRIVFIGFTTVQVARNVNVYHRFYSPDELVFVKPRYLLSPDGNLILKPSPIDARKDYMKYQWNPQLIVEIGKYDYWYSPLVYRNPLYDYSATVRLLSQAAILTSRKLVPRNTIVYNGRLNPKSEAFEITAKTLRLFFQTVERDGSVPIILLFPHAEALGVDGGQRIGVYEGLIEYLRKEGLEYLDLSEAFTEPVTWKKHFMAGKHYSPHSNSLVAKHIATYLQQKGLIPWKKDPHNPLNRL